MWRHLRVWYPCVLHLAGGESGVSWVKKAVRGEEKYFSRSLLHREQMLKSLREAGSGTRASVSRSLLGHFHAATEAWGIRHRRSGLVLRRRQDWWLVRSDGVNCESCRCWFKVEMVLCQLPCSVSLTSVSHCYLPEFIFVSHGMGEGWGSSCFQSLPTISSQNWMQTTPVAEHWFYLTILLGRTYI